MTAPATMTLDLTVPRRPGADDVDATLVNEDEPFVPHAGMPYAAQLNQGLALAAAAWRMLPVCSVEIHFSGGTPSIFAVQCGRSTVTAATFTINDNGPGDTTITWAADTLPLAAASPEASMVADGSWLMPVATLVSNGVRVKTKVDGGTLTDGNVKVHIH